MLLWATSKALGTPARNCRGGTQSCSSCSEVKVLRACALQPLHRYNIQTQFLYMYCTCYIHLLQLASAVTTVRCHVDVWQHKSPVCSC